MSPELTVPESPVPYQSSYEAPEKDEAQTQSELVETMTRIQEKTYADGGHALRSVHAKSHGLLQGELRVLENLPPELAQGLFARPAVYPLVMRFSTNPGDILDDSVSTPRGLALKIIGVEGERLPGAEGQDTQDFVMQNAPAFSAPATFCWMAPIGPTTPAGVIVPVAATWRPPSSGPSVILS